MSALSPHRRITTFALWIIVVLCPFGIARADEPLRFDIPSGPATDTLSDYVSQTGLQVVFGYDDVRGIVTNEVHGEFGAADALLRMTKGTRLRFEFIDADTVTVTVVAPRTRRTEAPSRTAPVDEDGPPDSRPPLLKRLIRTILVRSHQTGQSIREPGSQLITLTRTDIEAFGFATTQDVIRTLPQVFGGGPSEDTHDIGFEARTNAAMGSGVNLRGLGAGSTLVLVNGRRIAGGGSEGFFVDISSLPLSAIDHIEILPDSSSSVYGADAVGGVVNFILRDSFEGAQTIVGLGGAARGALHENQISQLLGFHPKLFDGLLAFDYYQRDSLPAADRRQARSDLTIFGGSNFDTIQSNPATILVGSRTWAVPRGQDGTQLDAASLIPDQQNKENRYDHVELLPSQQRWSLYGSAKKNVSERVKLFADTLFSDRDLHITGGSVHTPLLVPTTNPFHVNPVNPLAPVVVAYDFADDLGLLRTTAGVRTLDTTAGVDLEGETWHTVASADFASERLRTRTDNTLNGIALNQALADPNPETAFNPFGDGSHTNPATLALIRGSNEFTTNSQLWTGNVTLSRDLPGFHGASSRLALGTEYRRQSFRSRAKTAGSFQNATENQHRTAQSYFSTLSVPLLGKRSEEAQLNALEVSLAARYEDYSDFGGLVTPRFGLTWAPLDAVALRGTWSSSFRPPNLIDLDESNNFVTLFPVSNPAAPGTQTYVLAESGKNKLLREERARSWTLGLDLEPPSVPGLTAAVTYFNTTFTDRMNAPLAVQTLLTDPFLADLITRDPTPEQRQAVCSSARYSGASPSDCMTAPIAGIADLRVRNSALMRTNGIDLLAKYVHDFGAGTMTYKLNSTYILSFAVADSGLYALQERVSTQNNPIDLRLAGSLDWRLGPLRAVALVNYFDGYRDVASVPHRHVRSWTTLDLDLSYTTARQGNGFLSGTTFSVNAQNAFNESPPFLNNAVGIGYDQENADLTGRIVSVMVRKNW